MLLSIIPMFFYDFVGEKRERALKELEERRVATHKEAMVKDEVVETPQAEEVNDTPTAVAKE